MRKLFFGILLAFLLVSACSDNNREPGKNDPVAICENGKFIGYIEDNGVLTFKGIPYAKAPAGELRWKAPQKVAASSETFEAKKFGPAALQSYDPSEVASQGELSEDCLRLNVWTTDMNYKAGRPVMVWIHGGSYGWGGVMDPLYEGKYLVAGYPDVVLVTISYRVNAMGFIDFSGVPGGEAFPDAPYLGIMDQQQALRWVRKNISVFGGDPENITIFGESAGGGSVSAHLVAEGSEGLFKRAIAMSGDLSLERTKAEYDAVGQAAKLLAVSGCSDMAGLMALSKEQMLTALNTDIGEEGKEGVGSELGSFNNYPMRGSGSILPLDGYDALLKGASKDVDLMIGTVADEMRYWAYLQFNPKDPEGPLAHYHKWAREKVEALKKLAGAAPIENCLADMTADYDAVDAEYDSIYPGIWKYTEILNEYSFRLGAITMAENHVAARGNGKTYMYYFAKGLDFKGKPEEAYMNYLKACHACELSYAFNNLSMNNSGELDPELTAKFSSALVNFARTGNPDTGDEFTVSQYDTQNRSTLCIDRDGSVRAGNDPLKSQREWLLPTFKTYFLSK